VFAGAVHVATVEERDYDLDRLDQHLVPHVDRRSAGAHDVLVEVLA